MNSRAFRQFMGLQEPDCEYIEEWSRVSVSSENMQIIDIAWDPSEMTLIVLQKQNSQIKKSMQAVK